MSSTPIADVDGLAGEAPTVARELETQAEATGRLAEFVEQLGDVDVEEIVDLDSRLLETPPTEPERIEVRLDVVLPIEPDPTADVRAHTVTGDGTIPPEAEREIETADDRTDLDRRHAELEARVDDRRDQDGAGILETIEQEVEAATDDADEEPSTNDELDEVHPELEVSDDVDDDQEADVDVEDPAPELAEDLPEPEARVVELLADAGEATTKALGADLDVSSGTVHSYLSTLRDRDLVACRPDPRDGRRKVYRLASIEAPDEGVLEAHPAADDVEEEIEALEELVDESDQESDAVAHEENEDVDEGSPPPNGWGDVETPDWLDEGTFHKAAEDAGGIVGLAEALGWHEYDQLETIVEATGVDVAIGEREQEAGRDE